MGGTPATSAAKWLRMRARRIVMALCMAATVLVITYAADSSPYSMGGEVTVPQWLERFADMAGMRGDKVPDSVLLVNVAYDKALVPYDALLTDDKKDTRRLPAGHVAVTDRRKLADFLEIAAGAPYRYIMLDVRFDDDIPTDSDARRLFGLISTMPRVVFARHEDSRVSPDAPAHKAAYGDYYVTMSETNMVKYPVVKHDSLSLAARMHADLHADTLRQRAGMAFDGSGRLSKRSLFLTYPVRAASWTVKGRQPLGALQYNYHNLGNGLLAGDNSARNIRDLVAGRIVVVGDFVDDVHETCVGPMPGPLINYNAFVALSRGRHIVGFAEALLLFSVYAAISYGLIARHTAIDWLPAVLRRRKSRLLRGVLCFIGYSTLLGAVSVVLYLVAGVVYSIVVPSLCFTILNLWIRYRRQSSAA